MREIDKIAENLFEKVRDRFEDVSLGDENAKSTTDPEKARFFNFDYVVDGKNFGNITLSLIDEIALKVYFSKNISHGLDEHDKQQWYSFLRELREFSKRNLLSFDPRDITRNTLKHRDIQQQSKADSTYNKDEVVAEGRMYGTNKSSYEDKGPVKLIIRHREAVNPEQRGARTRKINSIFLETSEGERFKLPYNNLKYARAMARHVSEGGNIMDDFGQHITEIACECSKLRPFKSNMIRRTFEDQETQDMVESAFEYHGLLNNTLKKMGGRKGYAQCKEEFVATSTSFIPECDFDADEMRKRFEKRSFNDKLEDALPLVQKAYEMKKQNKFAQQFESWANNVAEGWDEDEEGVKQWGIEPINIDDLADLFAEPIQLGVDGINATTAIENIINNDELADKLVHAGQQDPEADARKIIISWLHDNVPAVYQELVNEIGDVGTPEVSEDMADDAAEENAEDGEFSSTYGSSNDGIDGSVNDQYNQYENDDESGMTADQLYDTIHRRIMHGLHDGQFSDLLRKLGPDGMMDAIQQQAEFHEGAHEWGSSDTSGAIRSIYRHAGLEFPEIAEDQYNDDYSMEEAVGDDYVNRGEKMARAGARQMPKEPSLLNKLKSIPKGAKAWVKGQPDDDKALGISEMRKLAGLE